jgi:hypothetical protein
MRILAKRQGGTVSRGRVLISCPERRNVLVIMACISQPKKGATMFTGPQVILQTTVDDIFSDPKASVVCAVPFLAANLLLTAAVYLLVLATADVTQAQLDIPSPIIVGLAVLAGLGLTILLVIGFLWTAVSWHRMIILGERPGAFLPVWPKGKIGGYLWRTILIGLLGILAMILLGGIGAILAPETMVTIDGGQTDTLQTAFPEEPEALSLRGILVGFVISAILYAVYLRLGMALPAQASGGSLTIGQAWEASQGSFFSLYLPLGALLSLIETVFTAITGLVSFGGVLDFIGYGVMTLLGIGVLTRLYTARFPEVIPASDIAPPA